MVLEQSPPEARPASQPTIDLRRARQAIKGGARAAQPVLVNGSVGVIVAPAGRLLMVMAFTIARGKIVAIDAISDPERLEHLDLAVLTD